MATTFHPLNAALNSSSLIGCGPVSGPSSLKQTTNTVPPGSVTDARLATYRVRSAASKVWNSPESSTVSNLRPKRSQRERVRDGEFDVDPALGRLLSRHRQ